MKVVRDSQGEAIAFGPNTDQYEPGIPDGATLTIEDDFNPSVKTTKQVVSELKLQLDSMERQAIMPRGAREAFIALCLQQGAAAHLNEAQLYAANPFFKSIKDADTAASAIRTMIRALT